MRGIKPTIEVVYLTLDSILRNQFSHTKSMANIESTESPPKHSFRINSLFRSISNKQPSFSSLVCTRPHSFFTPPPSPPPPLLSSPLLSSSPTSKPEKTLSSYRCISSMLKKDGRILSVEVSNGVVYAGSETNCIRIWKLPEFTECGKLKTKASMVCALAVSNDRVMAAYADWKIRIWRRTWDGVPTHVRIATIPKFGNFIRSYIAGKDIKLIKHLGPITSLAINVSDDLFYSASIDKTVKVWRISNLKCVETIQAHSEPVNDVVVDDDGVLYTASDDATVRVWRRNFSNGDRPHSLTITLPAKNSPVKTLVLTIDGGVLYGGCSDGYIHYWLKRWFSGQLQYGGALQGHNHAVMCLASVGNYVVSGSADMTSRVWVKEGDWQHSCIAMLEGHRGPVRCVSAFNERSGTGDGEEGCTVCTGSLDGVLKTWRVTYKSEDSDKNLMTQCSREYFEI